MTQPLIRQTSGKAIASLILSIVGIFVCVFIGQILGIIFGHVAKSDIRNSQGTLEGDSLATAGIVIGWVGILIDILFSLMWVGMMVSVQPPA